MFCVYYLFPALKRNNHNNVDITSVVSTNGDIAISKQLENDVSLSAGERREGIPDSVKYVCEGDVCRIVKSYTPQDLSKISPRIHDISIDEKDPTLMHTIIVWNPVLNAEFYEIQIQNVTKGLPWESLNRELKEPVYTCTSLDVKFTYSFRVRHILCNAEDWEAGFDVLLNPVSEPRSNLLFKKIVNTALKDSSSSSTSSPSRDERIFRRPAQGLDSEKSLTLSVLNGKIILVYFGANFCGPCRSYCKRLIQEYQTLKKAGLAVEIVFVSMDHDANDFKKTIKDMPWLVIPYESPMRQALIACMDIQQIPSVKAIAPSGLILDNDVASTPCTPAKILRYQSEAKMWQ